MKNFLLFSGSSNRPLAQKTAAELGISLSEITTIIFSEGNTFVRFDADIRSRDIILIQTIGLDPNNEMMELAFLIDAAKRGSAASVRVILPYFSYAKGDKLDEVNTSIRARVCADILETAGADKVLTMDLHAVQIQGFFSIPNDHVSGKELLAQKLQDSFQNLTVFSPDAGFVKEARVYAAALQAPLAIGDKIRRDHSENPEILEIIGEVKGRNILIVDDFAITGNSLMNASEQLLSLGAKSTSAAVSHCLMKSEAIKQLEASSLQKLYTLDTVDNPALRSPKIEVFSAAGVLADWIRSQ